MFSIIDTKLEGCLEILPKVRTDLRGNFVKTYHNEFFSEHNLETNFLEDYCSFSVKNVLRGLHFQTPPYDHVKLVYCANGEVFDVQVDLRRRSSTFGLFNFTILNSSKANMVYIPSGFAHGFCVLSETALVMYKVSSLYNPTHDTGLLWNSVNIPWPLQNPIMSERDKSFIPFSQFCSPFNE